jgi:cephalosporin hydroxylase
MNDTVLKLKEMKRAMKPYVLTLYEMILESKPAEVLEIGVRQAQSTRTILSALLENLQEGGQGRLTSIDLGDRSDRIPEELMSLWRPVVGDSHSEDIFKQVSDIQYDILFIDGDHSYAGVKKDYEMYKDLVKDGGYIMFHDTVNPNEGVKQFWDELDCPKINLKWGFAGFGITEKR